MAVESGPGPDDVPSNWYRVVTGSPPRGPRAIRTALEQGVRFSPDGSRRYIVVKPQAGKDKADGEDKTIYS